MFFLGVASAGYVVVGAWVGTLAAIAGLGFFSLFAGLLWPMAVPLAWLYSRFE